MGWNAANLVGKPAAQQGAAVRLPGRPFLSLVLLPMADWGESVIQHKPGSG